MIDEEWKYKRQNWAMIMKKMNTIASYSRWKSTSEERSLMMIRLIMELGNKKGTWS